MKILITGGYGQLGTSIYNALKGVGKDVSRFSRKDLDIVEIESIQASLIDTKADLIINCAAYTNVDLAETDKEACYSVNVGGVRNLVDVCGKFDIPLIHFSTDYVYSGSKDQPYKEDDSCDPLNYYGKTKYLGDMAINEGLSKFLIVRSGWIFSGSFDCFPRSIVKAAKKNSLLSVVADQEGNPTSAKSIGELVCKVLSVMSSSQLDQFPWGIYNFSQAGRTSWFEFACEIVAIATKSNSFGHAVEIRPCTTSDYGASAPRPKNGSLNSTLIQDTFHVEQTAWSEDLKLALEEICSSYGVL